MQPARPLPVFRDAADTHGHMLFAYAPYQSHLALTAGGERKLMEVLQLACLEPDLAILDEIDSGVLSCWLAQPRRLQAGFSARAGH